MVLIIFSLALTGNYKATGAEASNQQDPTIGHIRDIALEKMEGKERVSILVSKQPVLKIESQGANSVLIKLEGMLLPDDLKRAVGEGQMENITGVVPYQEAIDGKQWVVIRADVKQRVPYNVKQEGQNIYLDFNLAAAKTSGDAPTAASPAGQPATGEKAAAEPGAKNALGTDSEPKITVDFQNAGIKSVLSLFAETGGVNIVSGDDVKGNVTVTLKRVPWTKAFDTILSIRGLSKKQEGNIITVMATDRFKKEEAALKAAEDARKKIEQASMIEQGKLRQINIEAKIVEASEDFVRKLGVQWGAANVSTLGTTPYGVMGGTNPSVGFASATLPNNIGLTQSNLAVNFPSSLPGTPGIGILIGGTKAILDAQLSALESSAQGQIISAPKITTMDNVKATIKQGEDIPYTTYDSSGNPSVSFKEAVLKLEVTPKITQENKISMVIKATNDRGDYSRVTELKGNVPIVKNEVDSTVVVNDGETIVIGGVLKSDEAKSVSGVPWLYKIPVLGWLFKQESITKTKKHLLIFVTPKIISDDRTEEKSKT